MTALERILDLLAARGPIAQKGKDWRCVCPAHDDHTPSLDVTSRDGKVMFICRSKGCSFTQIVAALGIKPGDCFDVPMNDKSLSFDERIERRYPYFDADGKLLYESVRLAHPKDFRQRRPQGNGWAWNLEGVKRVPYMLPRLLANPDAIVLIVEGEKDVESLTALGFVATTNPMGAGKWKFLDKNILGRVFANRRVVILPDNDEPGKAHGADVRKSLDPMASQIGVLDLPGLGPKGDVSDWLKVEGNTAEKLTQLVEAALAGGAHGKPWEQKVVHRPRPGISASDLVKRTFEPTKYAIRNLLPEGLTVMAGRPKQGKSWLSLLLGWAVAGGNTLDDRESTSGDVLYLALEDTERRLQNRLQMLAPGVNWPVPNSLTVNTQWLRADQGGLALIAEWLESHKATAKLVIIDTLAKFRKPQKGTGNSYADDYEAIGGFKELLDHYSVSGLIVHHTRKLKAEDPFEELSGTQAIMGAADTTWVLDRVRGAEDAKLYVTGRDIEDLTIPLKFDPHTCRWTLGEAASGIDVEGRSVAENRSASKVEQCKVWLLEFLAEFAYPSSEITEAAKSAGFTFATIKDAKAALGRNGTGEVYSKKFGEKEWWSGLGEPTEWKLRDGNIPPKPTESSKQRHRKDTGEGDDGGF